VACRDRRDRADCGAQSRHPPRREPDTERSTRRPCPRVEAISPENNEITGLVDDIVDLRRPTGVLVIDGIEIPEDGSIAARLGVVTFRPGPDKELTRLRAGENGVVVKYWERTKDRPANPPSFSWRFRAAA
jgi:hypothetical protein